MIAALVAAVLLAGVVSYYASADPDGLNRVAEDKGFAAQEEASATADSPFAGYATRDVDDERLSGALAGVVGVVTVLVLAGGVAFLIRRRPADSGGSSSPRRSGTRGGDDATADDPPPRNPDSARS